MTRSTGSRSALGAAEDGKAGPETLLSNTLLWRAREIAQHTASESTGIPTGFSRLDELFHGHGWPRAALCEVLCDTYGIGELQLMAPGLAQLSRREERWIAWINPPLVPYAPALKALGIDIDKVLLIHPRNHKEALWALEKALQSGTCSAALAWLDESQLKLPDLRRIQVRAKQGRTWASLFRPASAVSNASSAELRINVEPTQERAVRATSAQSKALPRRPLTVSIVKRRGGWAVPDITIDLDEALPGPVPSRTRLGEQLSLWRASRSVEMAQPRPLEAETDSPLEMRPPTRPTHRSSRLRLM